MLACNGIFATPSIGIRSQKTASELQARRSFAKQKSVYANYSIFIKTFQYKKRVVTHSFLLFLFLKIQTTQPPRRIQYK